MVAPNFEVNGGGVGDMEDRNQDEALHAKERLNPMHSERGSTEEKRSLVDTRQKQRSTKTVSFPQQQCQQKSGRRRGVLLCCASRRDILVKSSDGVRASRNTTRDMFYDQNEHAAGDATPGRGLAAYTGDATPGKGVHKHRTPKGRFDVRAQGATPGRCSSQKSSFFEDYFRTPKPTSSDGDGNLDGQLLAAQLGDATPGKGVQKLKTPKSKKGAFADNDIPVDEEVDVDQTPDATLFLRTSSSTKSQPGSDCDELEQTPSTPAIFLERCTFADYFPTRDLVRIQMP